MNTQDAEILAVLMPATAAERPAQGFDPLATGAMLLIRGADGLRSLQPVAVDSERSARPAAARHAPIVDCLPLDLLTLNEVIYPSLS